MTLDEFHNGLRILLNLERGQLEDAGIILHGDHNAWAMFARDLFRFLIRSDEHRARKVWALMQTRMKA